MAKVRVEDRERVRIHGMTGAPDRSLDRDTRMSIYDSRARVANQKKDRWKKTSTALKVPEKVGGAAATGGGLALLAHQSGHLRLTSGQARNAAVATGVGTVVGGAAKYARVKADKQVRRNASMAGGVSRGTFKRMSSYPVVKGLNIPDSMLGGEVSKAGPLLAIRNSLKDQAWM